MKIGFIGAGKMAEAIIASMLKAKITKPENITASDISEERLDLMSNKYGIQKTSDNKQLLKSAEIVFFSVKPQVLNDVLGELSDKISPDKLVFSIVAGKKLATIEQLLDNVPVIRVMPNLPCQVGAGMTAFCLGTYATQEHKNIAEKLLSTFGRIIELPEDKFDAVTALSGSGPAFFAYLMNCLAQGAEKFGLTEEQARLLSCQTMLGTAKVLLDKNYNPLEFITAVTSPKGTTEAGRNIIEASDVSHILAETIKAATNRSIELSK